MLFVLPHRNDFLTTVQEHYSRDVQRLIGGTMHTPSSAARAIGVTRSTIYRAIKTGQLPAHKLSSGNYAIYPAELRRLFPADPQPAAGVVKPNNFSFPMWDVS